MTKEDYFKYYIQGSDHYLIPRDIFEELFNEMTNWKEESKQLKEENERLKQPTIFIDTQDMEERYGEELYKEYLEKEIEQLKRDKFMLQARADRFENIINKVEKFIKEEGCYEEDTKIFCDDINSNELPKLLQILDKVKGEENE